MSAPTVAAWNHAQRPVLRGVLGEYEIGVHDMAIGTWSRERLRKASGIGVQQERRAVCVALRLHERRHAAAVDPRPEHHVEQWLEHWMTDRVAEAGLFDQQVVEDELVVPDGRRFVVAPLDNSVQRVFD